MENQSGTPRDALNAALGGERVCDVKWRALHLSGVEGAYCYINGYVDSAALQRLHMALSNTQGPNTGETLLSFGERCLPFADLKTVPDAAQAAGEVLRGSAALYLDGTPGYLILDVRSYDSRGIDEPEKDRTLRGPHLGFNENAVSNLILIRRHLRTAALRTERFDLGSEIPNEVIMVYLEGKRNKDLRDKIRKKLSQTRVPVLSMTQETLADILFPQKGLSILNPFPRVRYTERPDVVAATLMEGKIALICDNTPSVMLLPENLFDFFEEADDYYFPPVTASYLKIVRFMVFALSVFLIPIWLLVAEHGEMVPNSLRFILTQEEFSVPLFLQFLIIEIALDGLRMASLNTPDTLSNSLSVVGGLLLGDFAVKSGWFVPQTILYSAFTGIANYIPTNYELGYSMKFCRISLILLVHFFAGWGLGIGIAFWAILFFSTRFVAGRDYLYPLFPLDLRALARIFFRSTKGREQNLQQSGKKG